MQQEVSDLGGRVIGLGHLPAHRPKAAKAMICRRLPSRCNATAWCNWEMPSFVTVVHMSKKGFCGDVTVV
jgi:hypothetical protein